MEYLILYLIGFPAFFYIAAYACQANEYELPSWYIALLSTIWPLIFILIICVALFEGVADIAKKRYANHQ